MESGFALIISDNIVEALGITKEYKIPGTGYIIYSLGIYTGQLNMWPKFFDINLKQIGTSDNILDGKNSKVLSKISVPQTTYGASFNITPTTPLYKKLTAGIITELELTFTDCEGKLVDNHGLPISIELEII